MLYRYIIASICVHPSYTSNREALIDLTAERVYLAFHSTENKKKILKKFLRNEKLKKEQIEKMIFLILIAGDIVNGKFHFIHYEPQVHITEPGTHKVRPQKLLRKMSLR